MLPPRVGLPDPAMAIYVCNDDFAGGKALKPPPISMPTIGMRLRGTEAGPCICIMYTHDAYA